MVEVTFAWWNASMPLGLVGVHQSVSMSECHDTNNYWVSINLSKGHRSQHCDLQRLQRLQINEERMVFLCNMSPNEVLTLQRWNCEQGWLLEPVQLMRPEFFGNRKSQVLNLHKAAKLLPEVQCYTVHLNLPVLNMSDIIVRVLAQILLCLLQHHEVIVHLR